MGKLLLLLLLLHEHILDVDDNRQPLRHVPQKRQQHEDADREAMSELYEAEQQQPKRSDGGAAAADDDDDDYDVLVAPRVDGARGIARRGREENVDEPRGQEQFVLPS